MNTAQRAEHAASHAERAVVRVNWSMIGVMLAVAVQTAAMIWWAAGMNERVGTLEQVVAPIADGTVVRIDERTQAMKETMGRIERQLDELGSRP